VVDSQATREGQRARTRANDYANVIYANDQHLHPKPKDALLAIQCHPVEGMPVPHFKCILRECRNCPKYYIPEEKERIGNNEDHPIAFHVYQNATQCSIHGLLIGNTLTCEKCTDEKKGKVVRRKHLSQLKRPLESFFRDFYLYRYWKSMHTIDPISFSLENTKQLPTGKMPSNLVTSRPQETTPKDCLSNSITKSCPSTSETPDLSLWKDQVSAFSTVLVSQERHSTPTFPMEECKMLQQHTHTC
jgi:hypothetical protein